MRTIRVGTRGSLLARTQTQQTIHKLQQLAAQFHWAVSFELVIIQTTGDQVLDVSLSKVGGKGLFTKEIEQALFDQEIDMAIHSMKDVPFEMPNGLVIGAIPQREDARDAWLSERFASPEVLPDGANVGTSSLRRQAALKRIRPDLNVQLLRGNVDTRIRKMKNGEYDAIILAAAGLHRLGWQQEIRNYLPFEQFVPAVGQGALAIQCRADDSDLLRFLTLIQDAPTKLAIEFERFVMRRLEGSCSIPLGVHADFVGNELRVLGFLSEPSGHLHTLLQRSYSIEIDRDRSNFTLTHELQKEATLFAESIMNAENGQIWKLLKGL